MTQPEIEIRSAWRHIAGHHHDGYIDDVLVRYAEPHRHYHTATHIMFVLRHLNEISGGSHAPRSGGGGGRCACTTTRYDPRADGQRGVQCRLAANDLDEIGGRPSAVKPSQVILATEGHLSDDDVAARHRPNDAQNRTRR